jgi:glycosyltransferase 2 family protein
MRTEKKKLVAGAAALVVVGLLVYRSRNMLHLGDFSASRLWVAVREANLVDILLSLALIYGCYALRALRWQIFQRNLGEAHFWPIYRMTLAGFAALFVLGRAGEPIRPLLLARRSKLPIADTFGVWVLERLYDSSSAAVIAAIGLLVYTAQEHTGESGLALENAARTTGSLIAVGVLFALSALVYLRLHGGAMLERRARGWIGAHGWRATLARIVIGFVRGTQTIRSWRELAESVFLSAVHWYFVVLIYLFVSHAFGGKLALLSVGDCMLVTAFTLVGSAVQLPGVGGGSQVACFLAYTTIFGIEKEPAAAAAIVVWLVTFASCSFAGIPLLIHEGFSFGQLRKMAEREKEELAEEAARGVVKQSRGGEADH